MRFGDAYAPPIEQGAADLVTIHRVLHFLSDPARDRRAGRLLKRGGRLVIVDFAPHGSFCARRMRTAGWLRR